MKLSTRQKGAAREKDVHLILELAGYRVARPGQVINYIPDGQGGRRPVVANQDMFGAFDLLAIHGNRPTLFVQVCSKDSGDIAERKRKIEEVPLPRSDVAQLWAWHGGGKRVDRRFRTERRYKPYQYYSVYRYWFQDMVKGRGEWTWSEPIQVFRKVHLEGRCWVCNQNLGRTGTCSLHPWADNGKVGDL